ncbi:hypothetical protein PI126_g10686 [Phytophthora idaei]|nr:hypothetical protein PI126_g10686 [Phytophthora idaei]
METPPLLTTVLALPSTMHGIPHLLELVNHYLLPLTIDNAVVNDLQLVMKIYGDSNSWTSGAMDGAAANDRLDVVQWLHDHRSEGCSAAAKDKVVANSHLKMAVWLWKNYTTTCRPWDALALAVKHGQCNQILVSAEDVAMLADFGLSFVSADSRPLTPSGAVRWKAPECFSNSNHIPTKELDVYSFGMWHPWRDCPDVAVVFQVKRRVALPRPKAFVDNEQWQFVQALCAPDPSKRIQVRDAIRLLKKFADHEQMQEWSSKSDNQVEHEFD